jgi:hypothetical protein
MSDFDDFLKESEGVEKEDDVRQPFETAVTDDKKQYRSLVDQLKDAVHYAGSDIDNQTLMIVCEEYLVILGREMEILRKQILELKDIKRSQVEKEAQEGAGNLGYQQGRSIATVSEALDAADVPEEDREALRKAIEAGVHDPKPVELTEEEIEEAAIRSLKNFGTPEGLDKILKEDID